MDISELQRLRGLAVLDVRHLMAEHANLDRDFVPVRALDTRRAYVTAAGAGDLVMHLWRVLFEQAAKMLRETGA